MQSGWGKSGRLMRLQQNAASEAWALKDDEVTSVLIGASKPEQILDNIRALCNTSFTEEELKQIDEIG